MTTRKSVLLFGGGGAAHDFAGICPVLQQYLGREQSFDVQYVVNDCDVFRAERIAAFELVVIYHTGGSLTNEQCNGLTNHVAAGCGLVGVHPAADSFRNSPAYIAMLGGRLIRHPCRRPMMISLNDAEPGIENRITHPVTRSIPGFAIKDWEKWPIFEYVVNDEQYLLDYDPRVEVIASTIYKGRSHPVAWTKSWGAGRVMYTCLGHHLEAIQSPIFQHLFVNGCRWAAGLMEQSNPSA